MLEPVFLCFSSQNFNGKLPLNFQPDIAIVTTTCQLLRVVSAAYTWAYLGLCLTPTCDFAQDVNPTIVI